MIGTRYTAKVVLASFLWLFSAIIFELVLHNTPSFYNTPSQNLKSSLYLKGISYHRRLLIVLLLKFSMGRTLFSQSYSTVPAVRIEPEPTVDLCEKWSMWNRFDPDSEDFFQDAEYEAFIDPAQYQREQEESATVAQADAATEISDSSESSSEQGSPMAVGSDDPAILIATYANPPWTGAAASVGWQSPPTDHSTVTAGIAYAPGRMQSVFGARQYETEDTDHLGNPAFIPPASFREPSPGIELDPSHPSSPPHSPTLRRTVNITPITVSTNPQVVFMPPTRSPSPDSSSTPPPLRHQTSTAILTPSPAPSVTPRFYSWNHHPSPTLPPSPSLRGNRDGPFTNPHARVSLMRIDAATARVRHSNIVT